MQPSKAPTNVLASTKRRSGQLDFSNLGPLKTGGTVGFSAFRDKDADKSRKIRKKSNGAIAEDSDDDEDDEGGILKMQDVDDKYDGTKLAPEDAQSSGELADGVGRIHVNSYHLLNPYILADKK